MLKFLTQKLRTHSLNEENVSEKVEERDSGTESDDEAEHAVSDDLYTDVIMKWNDVTDINNNPQHDNCPEGEDNCCKWQQAKALGTKPEPHPAALHVDVQKEILSIYEDISRDDLLTRCLGGHTQNANESFNSTVWRLAPKHFHAGLKIVEVAAFLATALFNEGHSALLMVMNELQLVVRSQSLNFAENTDSQRVSRQKRRTTLETKEARLARQAEIQAQNEAYELSEGLLCGAGLAD